jgi:MFS family permease
VVPYLSLLRDSIKLGFTDPQITIGYLGGFVARASTVAISLFIPLFVNTFFISNGFCQGLPNDPSPELKKECRAAYVLASILTGVAQLMGLICAPLFGYLSSRPGRFNIPIIVSTIFGIAGYIIFPLLSSPEIKNVDGRGGSPSIFLVVSLIGISQIGAIVCSLGSLGRGVLTTDIPENQAFEIESSAIPEEDDEDETESSEDAPLLENNPSAQSASRVRLKGSIAGVYSWCGGAAILLLTKLGGFLFDAVSTGAPFYMMAIFNGILLAVSLYVDILKMVRRK